MALDDRKVWAETHRDRPGKQTNAVNNILRSSQRGELGVMPFGKGAYGLADEGSYFMATNPTPGTGIDGIAAADGYDATEALLTVYNAASTSTDTRIYLDYLRLYSTLAPTSATDIAWVHEIDTAQRYSSGGSAITEVNVNGASTQTSSATIYFGAITAAAATANRLLGGGILRTVISVVGDIYTFDYGAANKASLCGAVMEGTTVASLTIPCCPVVLGPANTYVFQLNGTSQAAKQNHEFELGFWER
jgi:hypothetical protein